MSLRLSNVYAKRPMAGPQALQEAMDAAIKACEDAGRPSLDIACGEINMARWKTGNSELWHDATYDVHETRGIIQISDWRRECCFVGVCEPTASSSSAERSTPERASSYRMQI